MVVHVFASSPQRQHTRAFYVLMCIECQTYSSWVCVCVCAYSLFDIILIFGWRFIPVSKHKCAFWRIRVPRACFWGSASTRTARKRADPVWVSEQVSPKQPDNDAVWGHVPGPHVASMAVSSGMWLTACYACGTCAWWRAMCILQAEYASDGCEHIRWMSCLACSREWRVCS